MPRARPLLALLAFLAACEGCPEGSGVSTLTAAFAVEPAAIEVSPLWAGHPHTVTLAIESRGAAPILDLEATVRDVSGPAAVTATLNGDALTPGGQLSLRVVLSAPPGSAGPASAAIVIDAGSDGQVVVPLSANVALPPSCDDNNSCTVDRFDPAAGRCVNTTLDDGASCDDDSACTLNDACLQGRCVGEAVHCEDGVECTVDRCDPRVGCVFEPMPSRCDDDDPCTDDVCEPSRGCRNPPLGEGALCHFDGCNEIGLCFLGQCVHTEVPDGMPCEDGDACTRDDTCQGGECVPGEQLGVGAAPPIVLEADVTVNLCRGPDVGSACFGVVPEREVTRVLAVDRRGQVVRVLWQGAYSDQNGERCDPTAGTFVLEENGADEQADPAPPGEPPMDVCAAGVHLTTLPLGFGQGGAVTRQLTSVRGPAAAAFLPGAPGFRTNLPIDEPPTPRLPDADVVVVHPSFLRTFVWVEELSDEGIAALSPTRRVLPSDFGAIGALAVAADEHHVVVATHPAKMTRPFDICEAEGCEVFPVSLWVSAEARPFGGDGYEKLVHLPRIFDASCATLSASEVPIVLRDFTVALDGAVPRVSLRMTRSLCGDGAPSLAGFPDSTYSWGMAAWSFLVDDALLAAPGHSRVEPLHAYEGDAPIASFRTTPEGGAASLRHVPTPCLLCEECDAELDVHCECPAVEQTCFDTVLERTLDVSGGPPAELVRSLGVALRGNTVPLVVEGDLRVVSLLGGTLELLGRGPGGALSRLIAPAPPAPYAWVEGDYARLEPGPPESQVVVGLGRRLTREAVVHPTSALVQVFGCGFGEAALDDACLEPGDCDEGLLCDRSVCLPGPDCDANGTCDLCWGRCTEPPAPDDGGVPDDDAGAPWDGGDWDGGAPWDGGDPDGGDPDGGAPSDGG